MYRRESTDANDERPSTTDAVAKSTARARNEVKHTYLCLALSQ